MEREAFRQRMQQYKQARENNPQLKYWDWKSTVQREPLDGVYEDARFIDQSEPRFELRKGQQYYASPNNLKLMKVLGKTVKVLAPIGEVVQNLFPSEEAEIMQLQDAKAMIDLQEEAARRYKQYGIKPTQKDFRIKIDNAVTPSQEITNHEINHFNQYIHQDNPSWNKSELDKITKQFKGKLRDKNPIDPENTSYFMNWMEQNAYGINMLDRLKELNIKPTKQNILKYLKSLPDTDSIKKAALQFKNLDDYIKWLNTMPLADNGNINEIENYNFA